MQSSLSVTELSCDLACWPVLFLSRYSAFLCSPLPFASSLYVTVRITASRGMAALGGTAGSCQPGWSKMTLAVNRLLPGASGADRFNPRRGPGGSPGWAQGWGCSQPAKEERAMGEFVILCCLKAPAWLHAEIWGGHAVLQHCPQVPAGCAEPVWAPALAGALPTALAILEGLILASLLCPIPLLGEGGTWCWLCPSPCGSTPASPSMPGHYQR